MASTSGIVKKKQRGAWLLGGTLECLTGSKLPSNHQVLCRFLHLHTKEHKTIPNSAAATANEVLQFWLKARIPTRKECHIISKIRDLHGQWMSLKKNKSRRTDTQQGKEDAFVGNLQDLFDVAHADALTLIPLEEDKQFLLAQREKGRRGCMGPVDAKLAKREERRHQRDLKVKCQKEKEAHRATTVSGNKRSTDTSDSASASAGETTDDDSESTNDDSQICSFSSTPPSAKNPRPCNIVGPDSVAALDRTKTSDRNAVYVLAAAAQSLGHSPTDIALNKESIRQARRKHRETISNEIRASFAPSIPLTIHWDGKMLPSLTSKETVDRLAVIVSGEGVMKLLGVPRLPNGTGEAEASAVFTLIQDWNLTDRIKCMSFDTTASNTGLKGGACTLLEQKLGKPLLSLACRHHIHELIVANVFSVLMEPSSGPNIKLFQRFADYWNSIDRAAYESGMMDESIRRELSPLLSDLVDFIRHQLSHFHARDDYRELLQLALIFLGAGTADIHIHAPGAYHRARWMAKLIYSLKIYIFRSQFRLTPRELSSLRDFNVFVVRIYLKAWYTAPCPDTAPRTDLNLVKDLQVYKSINERVATAALKSFSGHLWYISETLVGLSFFDAEVPVDMKLAMVAALDKQSPNDDPPRRIKLDDNFCSKQLCDFVSSNTRKLFVALDIPQEFLLAHPNTWENNEEYICSRKRVKQLKVVNDAAERGVALMQTFNTVLSNQEEQKQFVLQVVEKHRREFATAKKSFVSH